MRKPAISLYFSASFEFHDPSTGFPRKIQTGVYILILQHLRHGVLMFHENFLERELTDLFDLDLQQF
jgi:hypothetical protein